MSDLAECGRCGRRVVAEALKRVGTRRVCPACVPESIQEETASLAESKRLAREAQAKEEGARRTAEPERRESEEPAKLPPFMLRGFAFEATIIGAGEMEAGGAKAGLRLSLHYPDDTPRQLANSVGCFMTAMAESGRLKDFFSAPQEARERLLAIYEADHRPAVPVPIPAPVPGPASGGVPACPRCGGPRRETVRSRGSGTELKWIGFGLVIVAVIIGCAGVTFAFIAVVPGLAFMVTGAIWESSTRKRWWICPACDSAEEAPRKASDL